MVRIRKLQSEGHREFSVRCDSKGRTGHWSCENLGPATPDRDDASERAKDAGWIVARNKWYCPDCQRDGFAPEPARPHRLPK
jgi:hypothetical protein